MTVITDGTRENLIKIAEMLPKYYVDVVHEAHDNADSVSFKKVAVIEVNDPLTPLHLAQVLIDEVGMEPASRVGGYARMNKDNPYYFCLASNEPRRINELQGILPEDSRTSRVIVIDYNQETNEVKLVANIENEDRIAGTLSTLMCDKLKENKAKDRSDKNISEALTLFGGLSANAKRKALAAIKGEWKGRGK